MKIKRFIGGTLMSNGYVVYQKEGGSCYIIDPGYEPKKFISFVKEKQLTAEGIIATHLHHDHTGAADAVSDALNCPIYMHEDDAFVYSGRVDHRLEDGDELSLDGSGQNRSGRRQ